MTVRTARSYAEITTLVLQMLQDTTPSIYVAAETQYWIEESLKELATYDPHIVPVVFQIESRTGIDETAAATTSTLTDDTKDQFLTTDPTYEKVIHNTTDNTWAVVLTRTSATVLTLSADIMDSGEHYEMYNKRCWNKRQIYIGDRVETDGYSHVSVPSYLWIDSVEYPIGTKRNWKVYGQVLEIDVDTVADSNLNVTNLPDVDVLVRFATPHRLCKSTDLAGAVHTEGAAGSVAIIAYGFTLTQVAEVGDEFHIANHRTTYTCTEEITWSDATNGNVLYFYPPLEAVATADDFINFTRSTLKPQHEELFCHLVAARCVLSDNINYINEINKGGPEVYARFREWGERKLGEVLSKLERLNPPRTKRLYTRG